MSIWKTVAVMTALLNVAAANAGEPDSATLFSRRPSAAAPDLSLDGRAVVYSVGQGPRGTRVIVADLATGKQQVAVADDGREGHVRGCRFVSNQRLVCRIEGEIDNGGVIVPYSRLFTVNADGSAPRPLGQRSTGYDARIRQFDAEIVDWLSGDDDVVLMARDYVPEEGKLNTRIVSKLDGLGVDRINVTTLASRPVEAPSKIADTYLSDGRGNVRMKGWVPHRGGTGSVADYTEFAYRVPGSKAWQPFSIWPGSDGMYPLHVDGPSNSALVLKKLNGRAALYRVQLDGTMRTELVYKNDSVDVDDLVRLGRDGHAIGVTFADDWRRDVYFDAEYAALDASLRKSLGAKRVEFLSESRDRSRLLIRTTGDTDPGHLYLFDRSRHTVDPLLSEHPELDGVTLAPTRAISFRARDGVSVPAYLTLPTPGADGRHLPAVVLPHGGPSARDEGDYDWLVQFLARQGYAVIQPNFRGSAGYGDAWLKENGFRGWKTSISDVVDSAHWLVNEGIADPARMAIVGWSYGGYAALQSNVLEPNLFKAAVAIAPVTDFDLLKRDSLDYTSHANVLEMVGTGPHVKEGSPLQNVDRIGVPVLLFHGDLDHNVAIRQSRALDDRLRGAGKPSELVVYPGLEHQLDDSEARRDMLSRIDSFLREHTH